MTTFSFYSILRYADFSRQLAEATTPERLTEIRNAVRRAKPDHALYKPETGFKQLYIDIKQRAEEINCYLLDSCKEYRYKSPGMLEYEKAQRLQAELREMRANLPVGPDPVTI